MRASFPFTVNLAALTRDSHWSAPNVRIHRALCAVLCATSFAAVSLNSAHAQQMEPRSYSNSPIGLNFGIVGYQYSWGDVLVDPSLPIKNANAKVDTVALGYGRVLDFWGESGTLAAVLPYARISASGQVEGQSQSVNRSGFGDLGLRVAVNLIGAPALSLEEFRNYRQDTIVGASFALTAPTGQYNNAKLVNVGTNRWSFKPEVGLSRRWGHWILDAYGGVWFFTRNPEFFSRNQYFPGTQDQTQQPIAAFETHLSYDVRPRLWVSLDANFWRGGTTSLNGVENPATLQQSSRVGVTASFPLTRHQSLKVAYADGAYIRYGGDYQIVAVAWQYSWIGKPN